MLKRLLVVLVAGLISIGQFSVNAQQKLPSYEKAECPFPQVAARTVECGYLTVPEDRANPNNGRTVKLAVAVFKSNNPNPEPDPTIYLEGGPGGSFLKDSPEAVNSAFAPFLEKRDFIAFDQRGTGYSTPSLFCPEDLEATWNSLGQQMSHDEAVKFATQILQQCHDRFAKENTDLSNYNSAESAADVADLRVALGYKQWNLYGISYGTRLALTVMRDHPEGVRSVILDSNIPPQIDGVLTVPAAANHIFRTFFDGCAKSPSCSKAYPNLEKTFYTLVDTLNAHPVTTRVKRPGMQKQYPMILTGDDAINNLFFSFYLTDIIPQMPAIITQAANGDYRGMFALEYNNVVSNENFSTGMYYSVNCSEEVSFDTPEQLEAADDAYPQQRNNFDPADYIPLCKVWGVKGAPSIETKPVVSDLPSLVMEGSYDPITPPDFGKDTAKYLKNSFYVEFPGVGHGTSIEGQCPTGIALAFLDNPTQKPDSSCISKMTGPRFTIIDTSQFTPTPPSEPQDSGGGGST
jgi:pimeloyl-ACP methyl ester carboxylesterase